MLLLMTTTMISGISWIININQPVSIAAAAAAAAAAADDNDNDNDNSKGSGNDNNGDDNDRMEGQQATVSVSKQIFFHFSLLQLYVVVYDDISLSLLAVIL